MVKRLRILAAAALLALAGANAKPALAEVRITYDAAGQALFSVAAPDNWIVTTGGEALDEGRPRVIGMHPEDDFSLWIGFFSPSEARTIEDAEEYVKSLGPRIVKNAAVERQKDGTLGGMPARLYTGTGTRGGAPVDFSVGIVSLPGGRQVIGIFLGEYGARTVYQTEIDAIAQSLMAGKDGH